MKNYRKRAMLLVLAVVAIIFGVDAYWLATEGYFATVSYNVYTTSKENPAIPFVIGFIMGHLFFPQGSESYTSGDKKDASGGDGN